MERPLSDRYGVLRSVLITIGVTAFAFLLLRKQPVGYVAAGIALQLLLTGLHLLVKHKVARMLVEVLGDGITVLLFALAVLGAPLEALREL